MSRDSVKGRWLVLAIAGALTLWLAVAAVAGPTTVWVTPELVSSADVARSETPVTAPVKPTAAQAESDGPRIPSLGRTVAILGAVFLLVVVVLALREMGPPITPRSLRLPPKRLATDDWESIPSVDALIERIDVVAARSELVSAASGDGIIQCWIRVQHDLASIGFKISGSETPTEYVERVEGGRLDRLSPIAELAALYTEARFSEHEMTDLHMARAREALDRVTAHSKTPADPHR